MSTIKINMDFYNNTLTTINAKQHDTFARTINVTCTDQGRKIFLDKDNMSVYVGVHKSDSEDEFEHAEILSDGTININLTENMLSTSGRCYFDVIVFGKGGLTVDDIRLVFSMEDLNTSVISTMPICLNVIGNAVSYAKLEKNKNYNGLLYAISLAENMEVYLEEQEIERQDRFDVSIDECGTATQEAIVATNNAITATNNANIAIENVNEVSSQIRKDADSAIKDCRDVIDLCSIATSDANTATENCKSATGLANEATMRANTAAEACESVIDGSGIVLKSEKGVPNGVASLDENGKVPNSQLNIVNNLETTATGAVLDASQGNVIRQRLESIEYTLNGLSTIHFNNVVDNSIGENGDILMVPIS